MAPASRSLDAEVLGDLPQEVVTPSLRRGAPSRSHALKWNLLIEWCFSHKEDPRKCPIRVVLSFLQQGLERRLSPSTLKVYVAAIAVTHGHMEGKSVGKHDWVIRFLKGARRLNPPLPPLYPLGTSWHVRAFADSRAEVPLNENSTPACTGLHQEGWGPACIFDRRFLPRVLTGGFPDNPEARPGYVPKVPTTPFRDQVVSLQALPPEEADPALALLYPVIEMLR